MKSKFIGILEEIVTEAGELAKYGKNFFATRPAAEEACEQRGIATDKIEKGKNKKTGKDGYVIKEGKRGRPKKDEADSDESGKSGVRDITLIATIKIDGKKEERKKKLTDVNSDDIDKEKDKFEREVNKEYDYDADVTVKVKIGDYEASADAEDHMYDNEGDGEDSEDTEYSIGRKDK